MSQQADRRRISALCIDAAPNSFLTLEMARAGGGVAKFLSSDPCEEDVTACLSELLAAWRQPVVAGLRPEVGLPSIDASGRQVVAASESGWQRISEWPICSYSLIR